jgi:hypothetical protein
MEALAAVALLHMPAAPRFTKAEEVDRCYKAFDPDSLRPSLVPLLSTAAVIGLVMIIVYIGPF